MATCGFVAIAGLLAAALMLNRTAAA
jgi:hypothetical protein